MTDAHMRRILSDRPIGKPAWSLACFLYGTWVSERLSGHLSKLQPNQAPCHLSNKFSLFKLLSSRMLHHACGRPKWPPLRMDASSINLDRATQRTAIRTRSAARRGVASHHNESSIPDTYLNSCIPFSPVDVFRVASLSSSLFVLSSLSSQPRHTAVSMPV